MVDSINCELSTYWRGH